MSKKVSGLAITKVFSIATLVTAVFILLGSTMAFAYTQTTMAENFESWAAPAVYANGQNVGNWTMYNTEGSGTVELQGTSNKSLVLSTKTTTPTYWQRSMAKYNIPNARIETLSIIPKRYMEVSFDMQSSKVVPASVDQNGQVIFGVIQNNASKSVFGYSNDTFFDAKTWGSPATLSSSVGTTKHTLKIIFDTSSAKTATFYVDGALKGTATYTASDLQGISGIYFQATKNYQDATESLKMYIDNVSILTYDIANYLCDFNSFTVNTGYANPTTENGWNFSWTSSPTTIMKIIDQGSGDKCLNIDTSADSTAYYPDAKYTLTSATTERFVDLEYKVKFANTYKVGPVLKMTFNDNSTRNIFGVSEDQYVFYTPNWGNTINTLAFDQYHRVKIRFDTVQKMFYLFINDVYVKTIDISGESRSSAKTGMKAIEFFVGKGAKVSIDDVAINKSNYISSLITNNNGEILNKVASGTLSSNVEITNPSVSETMPVLIAMARYRAGKLVGISSQTVTVAAGGKNTYNPTIACDGTEDYVKTFVFDSISTTKPYFGVTGLSQTYKPTSYSLIPANDTNMKYIGRWDSSDTSNIKSNWHSNYFKTKFTGTTAKLLVNGNIDLSVQIDGNSTSNFTGVNGIVNLTPTALSAGTHTLFVESNTSNSYGYTFGVGGLILDNDATTQAPMVSSKIVEFIGDSITAGTVDYATQASTANGYEFIKVAYAGITLVDGLNTNYAYTPTGTHTNTGMSYQFFKSNADLTNRTSSNNWSFNSTYTPNAVVINLGTNDYSLGYRGANDFTVQYITFIQNIRAKYPNVPILAMTPFGIRSAATGNVFTAIQHDNVVSAVNTINTNGDRNVYLIDTTGWINASNYTTY